MIYEVNAHLLKMLNESDFRPANKEVLEAIINAPRKAYNLNRAFDEFEKWFNILPKNSNTNIDALLSACTGLYTYYFYLKEHLEKVDNYEVLYSRVDRLEHHDVCYFENNVHEMFDLIANCFTLTKGKIPEIKLVDDIEKKDVEFLYKCFIGAYSKLFTWITIQENELQHLNSFSWSDRVLGKDWEMQYGNTLAQNLTRSGDLAQYLPKATIIPGPQFVLVSFCENTSKLYYSTQNVISASLINTKSHKCFHDRAFGFMYNFSTDNLFAMSFEDANSSCWWNNTLEHLLTLLIKGEPLLSVIQGIQASPIDLSPLYNFDELLAKTEKYNEVLLKPQIKTYGIFVWEDELKDHFSQVCSLSTVFCVPLFICRADGSLVVINWQNVFEDVKKYLEKIY